VSIHVTGAAPPAVAEVSEDEIFLYLRDHVGMGVTGSVRPASPAGWVLTVGGRELTLADEHQALIRVTAIGAYQETDERLHSVPDDSPYWKRAGIGGGDGD
jgi:hypothetical protein